MSDKKERFPWVVVLVVVAIAGGMLLCMILGGRTHNWIHPKKGKSKCGDICKMYVELKELRERNEFLQTELRVQRARWKSVENYVGSICNYPSRFDMRFDFAYGGCKPAKKRHEWDLATRDRGDQILFWYCQAREEHPVSKLPKAQRAKLYRDSEACLLRWVRVMEMDEGSFGYSRNGVNVTVNWKRMVIHP